jgi:type VI secretion system secreted protein VgrG
MFAQSDRPIQLTTPLGADKLVAQAIQGHEAISELFSFRIDAMWQTPDTPIAFDQLLGNSVTVSVATLTDPRYFNGIVTAITQASQEELFTHYRLDIAPDVWKLTRNVQCRIFQQKSIPDILKAVFAGYTTEFQLHGTYEPREYCVQYRESDFNFASRLMEEEGIFYFFKHSSSGNTMVIGDTPQTFQNLPFQPDVIYDKVIGGVHTENRIYDWEKAQHWRSGKVTLWDHTFEMPDKNLQAQQPIQDTLQAGTVSHKFKVGGNDSFELYDYPGEFSKRFDGISTSGGEQSSNLQKIFNDNSRTAGIRMQQEAVHGLTIFGQSSHPGFLAGFKFTLQEHFTDNGDYTLVRVRHSAHQALSPNAGDDAFRYDNSFSAIPSALPFRPSRTAAIPFVHGVQTAVVVGPSGEEIYTDKYGRVKVQFHWDRQGQNNASSSCWLRVATVWAQKQWGAVHIPRIGQEVIVAFFEGDPDQPVIVGAVYNADNMPPYTLPDNKTQSGIKSRSTLQGSADNFNEIFFEDKKGSELVRIHAEKDQNHEVEHDDTQWVGHDRATTIDHDETRHIKNDRTTTVDKDETKTVHGKETITIDGDQSRTITQGNQTLTIDMGNQTNTLKMGNQSTKLNMGNQSTNCDLGAISMEAMQSITLKVGASKITIDQMGVTIEGMMIKVNAQIEYQEQALLVQSQASALMQIKGAITMIN